LFGPNLLDGADQRIHDTDNDGDKRVIVLAEGSQYKTDGKENVSSVVNPCGWLITDCAPYRFYLSFLFMVGVHMMMFFRCSCNLLIIRIFVRDVCVVCKKIVKR